MDWANIITELFELVLFPLLGIGTTYLIMLINTKIKETQEKTDNETLNKYLDMLNITVSECVRATTQTYVKTLKEEGKFDVEAQKIAFQKTFDNVMVVLADDAKEYLMSAIGDFEAYVNNKIEAEINLNNY